MAEKLTASYGFFYYDQFDIDWHVGLNNNWLNLDAQLATIEQEVADLGNFNFIPHTLFDLDSDSDGVPELWGVVGGITFSDSLSASELVGYAYKYVATLDNSGGGAAVTAGLKISDIIPPGWEVTFSAYVKCDQTTKLRLKNGAADIDSAGAVYSQLSRVAVSGTLDTDVATTELSVLVDVPAGQTATLEFQLPMLNGGLKAAAYLPNIGEMKSFVVSGDLYPMGPLKANLNFNQRKALSLRLEGRSSDPSGLVSGQVWYNTDRNRPRFYDGSVSHDLSVCKASPVWVISGSLGTGTEQGGVFIAPQALVMEKAYIYCKTTGSSGATIVDINKNGTTVFTTQANRPQLAYDDSDQKAVSGTPDITALAEGDIVTVDIDQIATGAQDLSLVLICR